MFYCDRILSGKDLYFTTLSLESVSRMKFNHKSPYLLTNNQENTFSLVPVRCDIRHCGIELNVNGMKMTNREMPGIEQIRIVRAHLQRSVAMKGTVLDIPSSVRTSADIDMSSERS